MSKTLTRLKWPLLVILLCLPAAFPYLGGDIPRSNDTLTHLYRAVELDRLVRSGDLFPRWGPDFAHGYGYPIFNYFAYFSHYLIVLFHLTGLSLLWGVRLSYVVATLGAGVSAYLLGKTLANSHPAGLVSAVAFVYSPYFLYTANVRGGLPENLALAFLPLALWGVYESLTRPDRSLRPVRSAIAVLAIAGFIASHVGMAIQYLPLLTVWGAYCVGRALFIQNGGWPRGRAWFAAWPGLLTLALILALGLGVTAFLWLPSVVELPYVQFASAFQNAGLVYTANFLHFSDIFAYPALPLYTQVLNPPVLRALSIPVVVLALAGLLLFKHYSRGERADYLFLLVTLVTTVFLSLDISKPIWDLIPLLQRSTFPWRFLGPAGLAATLLAGLVVQSAGQWLARQFPQSQTSRWQWAAPNALALIVLPVLIAASAPFMFPPREPALENPTLADLARFEIPPLLVATTTTGEYTPVTVKQFPDTHAQQAVLEAGQQPQRLDAPGATLEHLSARPAADVYKLTVPTQINAVYRSFYFPGWQVLLDGQPLPITPTDPDGLISFTLPAGTHTLEVQFGSTPVRTIAGWLSGVSLAALLLGLLVFGRITLPALDESFNWKWAAGLVVLSYGVLWLVAGQVPKPGPPVTQHPLNLDYGGELTLLGYNQQPLANGNSEITLVWQAQHVLGVPYGFNVRLTDDRGLIYSDTNIDRPAEWRFYPGTDFWQPDQYILDSYILKPISGTPPGLYHLDVIAYRTDTLQALSDQVVGDYEVAAPTNEPLAAPLLSLDGLNLVHLEADRPAAAPGEPYRLSLRWQASRNAPPEQTVALDLVDGQGQVVLSRNEPLSPLYPPSNWKTGDVINQDVFFRLPARLPGGSFHWRVGGSDLSAPVALTVNEPQRVFVLPAVGHVLPTSFGLLSLAGWDASITDKTATVILYWQASHEMAQAYRVFLHALDSQGNLVAQSDGEPVNWTRPTTGWLAGEVILDSRTLTFSATGTYALEAGLVDEAGNRVGPTVALGQITIP